MIAARALRKNAPKANVGDAVPTALVQQFRRKTDAFSDPQLYTGFKRQYLQWSRKVARMTTSQEFSGFIIFVIIIAGLLVGIQTYEGMDQNPIVNTIDTIILGVFSFEVVCKIIMEGFAPWRYFIGQEWRWNNFDFIIVILCMPFIPVGGSSVSFLRMLRLMRVAKLVRKVPQLQMIVMGLIGGMKSIAYILLLLFLVRDNLFSIKKKAMITYL